jgi:hypothetical protein
VGITISVVGWIALSIQAQAQVIGNDVGRAIEKATQDLGKALDKATHDTQKTIEEGAHDAGKNTEKGSQEAAKLIEKAVIAQGSTDSVLGQLARLPLDKLYGLKVSPDICASTVVSCESLDSDRVSQFVDVEIDRRKAAVDYEDKRRSFFISLGSLVISCGAFAVSVFWAFGAAMPLLSQCRSSRDVAIIAAPDLGIQ